MSRPSNFDFDIIAAMRGFMVFRKNYAYTDRHWAYSDEEYPSVYNMPVILPNRNMIHGWGSHWYGYAFDERFLKHVIYYHFAEKGSLQTWCYHVPDSTITPEAQLDLAYVKQRGNTLVCVENNQIRTLV